MAFLSFIACLAGIVCVGWVVSKITGAKAQCLETFALEPGERVRGKIFRPTLTRFMLAGR